MPVLNVIWDTNVYRQCGRDTFIDITTREQSNSVVALANYFVAAELLAHLADPTDRALPSAVSSLRRMWNHGKRQEGDREVLDFVADSEAQVCWALFAVKPPRRAVEFNLLGGTPGELANVPTTADLGDRSKAVVRAIKKHVDTVEQAFVDDLFSCVVQQIDPAATTWSDASKPGPMRDGILAKAARGDGLPLVAQAFAIKAARDAEIQPSKELIREKGRIVQELFPTPVFAYDLLIQRMLTSPTDMSTNARRNSIWDLQVALSTASGAIVNGAPLWVVTDDELLLQAARRAGTCHLFRTLSEYRELLALDAMAFQDILQSKLTNKD